MNLSWNCLGFSITFCAFRSCLCEHLLRIWWKLIEDLEPSLHDELIQFICHEPCNSTSLKTKQLRTWTVPSGRKVGRSWIASNVEVMLRIYLTLMVTNCSGERWFSTMSRAKSQTCTSMSDDCLNVPSLLCVDLVRSRVALTTVKNKDSEDESPKSASELRLQLRLAQLSCLTAMHIIQSTNMSTCRSNSLQQNSMTFWHCLRLYVV